MFKPQLPINSQAPSPNTRAARPDARPLDRVAAAAQPVSRCDPGPKAGYCETQGILQSVICNVQSEVTSGVTAGQLAVGVHVTNQGCLAPTLYPSTPWVIQGVTEGIIQGMIDWMTEGMIDWIIP